VNAQRCFVDTWGWLALGHRRDSHHGVVTELFRSLRSQQTPLDTSDYVLDELITLLYRRSFKERP
jgi:predicted nucleic acid-binding protein